jgi:hypothetical protein
VIAAIAFLKKHLNIRTEIKGPNREDIYEIPLEIHSGPWCMRVHGPAEPLESGIERCDSSEDGCFWGGESPKYESKDK